jgi:hypothetical protein
MARMRWADVDGATYISPGAAAALARQAAPAPRKPVHVHIHGALSTRRRVRDGLGEDPAGGLPSVELGQGAQPEGRWRVTGDVCQPIGDVCQPIGPRPGVMVRSLGEDAGRARVGDQLQQPELLCRIAQNGEDGSWSAEDPDGNELRVETAQAGRRQFRVQIRSGGDGRKGALRAR